MEPNFKNGILLWAAVFLTIAAIITGAMFIFEQPSKDELRAQALEELKADIGRIQKIQENAQ